MTVAPKYALLPKLWEYIHLANAVNQAMLLHRHPMTDCLTANAYDFRLWRTPTDRKTTWGLAYLGIFNTNKVDPRIFLRNELDAIEGMFRKDNPSGSFIPRSELRKLIVQFRNYDQVRKGQKKWKLLPKYNP